MQLNADGYGSHTSPTHHTVRTPLVPRDLGEDFSLDFDDEPPLDPRKPKNAKYVTHHFYQLLKFQNIYFLPLNIAIEFAKQQIYTQYIYITISIADKQIKTIRLYIQINDQID